MLYKLSSLQILHFRPKVFVNDWLTVTNWVPRVNDAQGHSRLPKTHQPGVTLGPVTKVPADIMSRSDVVIEELENIGLPQRHRTVDQIVPFVRRFPHSRIDLQYMRFTKPLQIRGKAPSRRGVVVIGSMNQQDGSLTLSTASRRMFRTSADFTQEFAAAPNVTTA